MPKTVTYNDTVNSDGSVTRVTTTTTVTVSTSKFTAAQYADLMAQAQALITQNTQLVQSMTPVLAAATAAAPTGDSSAGGTSGAGNS